MKLYEIDDAILSCIDEETGEILDVDKLNALQIEREQKVESVALWIKDLAAENAAIKAEKERLDKLSKSNENRSEALKNWLKFALDGSPFKTVHCQIGFKPSQAVVIDNEEQIPEAFLKVEVKKSPMKTEIKKAILAGTEIAGAHIEDRVNVNVK